MATPARLPLSVLILLAPLLAGCSLFAPSLKLPPPAAHPAWQTATADELVADYNRGALAIETLTLTADLTATPVGGSSYSTITGHVLYARPESLRIYGEVPMYGKAFDMAAQGDAFELNLPSRSEFVVGRSGCVPADTKNPLERMRPSQIMDALPVRPIAGDERRFLLDDVSGEYNLVVVAARADGSLYPIRRLVFSRVDLTLQEQILYNSAGERTSVVSYGDPVATAAGTFPGTIILDQPGDFRLQLKLSRPPEINQANAAFADPGTFHLTAPGGAKVINADTCGPGGGDSGGPPG